MIVGEAEIQGQVKRAYELALVEGATGPILNRLFRGALAAGKRARTETGISERALSVPSVAVELAQRTLGDLASRRVLRGRRRRDGRADRPGARRARGRGRLHRQPPLRPGDRPRRSASAAARSASRSCPTQMERADIVVASTSSPHHVIERDELAEVMARARGPAAAADRPRGAARHPPGLPRPRRGQPPRHGRPPGARRAQRLRPRGRGAQRRDDPARRAGPLRALARLARRSCPPSPRCASAPTRSSTRVLAENEPRWESADRGRPRAPARRWRARSPAGCCTSRRCACKRSADEEDAYATSRALRELFGLDAEHRADGRRRPRSREPAGAARPPASVRPSVSDRADALGTRGSALALAQAETGRRGARRRRDRRRRDRRTAAARRQGALRARRSSEALLAGEVDLGVHSAKDLPGELPDGARAGRRAGARGPRRRLRRRGGVARRAARRARGSAPPACAGARSCSRLRPDLELVELRGNVDTRLRKLADGRVRRDRPRRGRAAPPRPRRRDRLPLRARAS